MMEVNLQQEIQSLKLEMTRLHGIVEKMKNINLLAIQFYKFNYSLLILLSFLSSCINTLELILHKHL
jgi:hypothetical protein